MSFEVALLSDPTDVPRWLSYAESVRDPHDRAHVLARAAHAVPDREIWQLYLDLRVQHLNNASQHERDVVSGIFDDAVSLFPRDAAVWDQYMTHFPEKRTFDRALRQVDNAKVWPRYLEFAESLDVEELADIYRRYLEFEPSLCETVAERLIDKGAVAAGVQLLEHSIDSSSFTGWRVLLETVAAHPSEFTPRAFESALQLFPSEDGTIYPQLALYYSNSGQYAVARTTLEQGLQKASSVRAFVLIFQTECEFLDALLEQLIDVQDPSASLWLEIYVQLLARRRLLLNDVLIRAEPQSVEHWLDRTRIWEDPAVKAEVFAEALITIDPKNSPGLSKLWLEYAKLYATSGDLDTARTLLDSATKARFGDVEDLVDIWIGWADLEWQSSPKRALKVLSKAVAGPRTSDIQLHDKSLHAQERLHKSLRLWLKLVNSAESAPDMDISHVRFWYERIIELRIATVSVILQYARFLQAHDLVDESFRVYEQALDLFDTESAGEIWRAYLAKATDGDISIERMRDLYEQALENSSPRIATDLFKGYIDLERKHGLWSTVKCLYERAVKMVDTSALVEYYKQYLSWTKRTYGLEATRPVYAAALQSLEADDELNMVACEFAAMEVQLGQIERARAVYEFASQLNDPQTSDGAPFWDLWQAMELAHGTEDTFRYVLEQRRQVSKEIENDVYKLAQRERQVNFVKAP